MKIVRTWACSLSLLSLIVGGVATTPLPTCAQKANTSTKIRLVGPAIAGKRPEGSAEFRVKGTRSSLEVEAEKVNLPNGMVLSVNLNGTPIGAMTLVLGKGKLDLEGKGVPAVQSGTVVTITDSAGNVILHGTF